MTSTREIQPAAAFALDAAAVATFCAIGRRSHAEGVTVGGVGATAWPFLTGTAAGWAISRGWRRPTALNPTGLIIWVTTIVVGMVLRKAISASVAAPFIVVSSTVTGVLLLGWRGLFGLRRR